MPIGIRNVLLAAILMTAATPALSAEVSLSQTVEPTQTKGLDAQSEASKDINFELLVRSAFELLRNRQYSRESEITISGGDEFTSLQALSKIKTIAEAPNKFRTDISVLDSQGEVQNQFLVISDGNQVWISNPNEGIYSVSDYASFSKSKDDFMVGPVLRITSMLDSGVGDRVRQIQDSQSEDSLVKFVEAELQKYVGQLSKDKGTLSLTEQEGYQVYSYFDLQKNFNFSAHISPEQQSIAQVDMNGQEKGINFKLKEKVLNTMPLQSIPDNTFTFTPPPNAKRQDKQISLIPFPAN